MNTDFTRKPGRGYLGCDFTRPDAVTPAERKELKLATAEKRDPVVPHVSGVSGYVTVPGHIDLRIQAKYSKRLKGFEGRITTFGEPGKPETWQTLGEFKAPMFTKGCDYVDTTLEHAGRKYALRIIRRKDRGDFIVTMPQVVSTNNNPAFAD